MSDTHGNVKIQDSSVEKIIEKPGKDKKIDDYYSIPLYAFTQKLFSYLDQVKESSRGELELPSAIKLMLSEKLSVRGCELCKNTTITSDTAGKYHITYIKDLLLASFRFLNQIREHPRKESEIVYITSKGP